MAVITKEKRKQVQKALLERFNVLYELLNGKELSSNTDGCRKGHWRYPDQLVKIDNMELSLAIGDFKTILDEIKKFK